MNRLKKDGILDFKNTPKKYRSLKIKSLSKGSIDRIS